MTTEQLVIKRGDLVNRRVLDRKTVEEVGKVDQIWVDPQSHQAIGFTCKSGFLGKNKRWFAWSQIDTVGENILVNVNSEESTTQQPEQAVAMIGNEVLTDTGNQVGSLVDYFLDVKTGGVVNYLFKSSGLRGILDGIYLLSPTAISSVGPKGLIVSSEAIAEPQHYTEGLTQKMGQAKEMVMEKAQAVKEKASEQTQAVMEKAQAVKEVAQEQAQAVMEKAQVVKEKASEQAQAVMEKAQVVKEKASEQAQAVMEKAQVVKEKASEQAQAVKEKASEQAQAVMEKAQVVKEKASEQAQSMMEKAQAVKEIAQEKIDEVRNRREDTTESAGIEVVKEGVEEAMPESPLESPKDPE
ncbi:hypothetical protein BCD67_04210 [Oscillatoriales cyanobacterium USR001]|nr:hypothetical protein BCD67_04210 [Oscillatoriales cyanobacterium USR001]